MEHQSTVTMKGKIIASNLMPRYYMTETIFINNTYYNIINVTHDYLTGYINYEVQDVVINN